MDEYAYILVRSVHQSIKINKILSGRISCKMVPVPRHLSSDCGTCVRIELDDMNTASALIAGAGIEPEGIGY